VAEYAHSPAEMAYAGIYTFGEMNPSGMCISFLLIRV
jgi:hypothetical protein